MTELRRQMLDQFAAKTGLPALDRVVQHGTEPTTARYTFEFRDGREVRVGGIDILWSRTNLSKVLAVTIQTVVAPLKPADWTEAVGGLVQHAVDVEERPGETFQDAVEEWLAVYLGRASNDKDGAASMRVPFIHENEAHLHAETFAKHIRREYSETIKLPELRQALVDLGFERTTVHYATKTGTTTKRSTASYYRAPLTILDRTDPE